MKWTLALSLLGQLGATTGTVPDFHSAHIATIPSPLPSSPSFSNRVLHHSPPDGDVPTTMYGFDLRHHASEPPEASRDTSRHRKSDERDEREAERVLQSATASSLQVTPLFQGIGTHYSEVWVGTPPQRQSVIVDTGSHYTAFPCTGCNKCGDSYHTNLYFSPTASSTFEKMACHACEIGTCRSERCEFSQSYTEGSSWHAYSSTDVFWCGRDLNDDVNNEFKDDFSIEFMFGCQYSETGLFETQLANGIMGMSASESTFMKKLYDAGKVSHNMFTMCFQRHDEYEKEHGVLSGAMVFGGVDTRLHTSPMLFVENVKKTGWFTVYVNNAYLKDTKSQALPVKIPIDLSKFNSGKGIIVDSGTTDTYLHSSMRQPFMAAWKDIVGSTFSNVAMSLTEEQVLALPTFIFQLKSSPAYNDAETEGVVGASGNWDPSNPSDILVEMPASHYMEYNSKRNKYTPRIYFTEGSGGVFGANWMQGQDVLFDWENGRVGFAKSDCDYDSLPVDGVIEEPDVDCTFLAPDEGDYIEETCSFEACEVANNGTVVAGTEKWARVVAVPTKGEGLTCDVVASEGAGAGTTFQSCDGDLATCYESRVCSCSCGNVKVDDTVLCKDLDEPAKSTDDISSDCEDLWGSCHLTADASGCEQTKVTSVLNVKDGNCYKVGDLTSRECHTQVCGMDSFRVPFKVQVVFGLPNVFTGQDPPVPPLLSIHKQFFEDSVALSISDISPVLGVDPGDVYFVSVGDWVEGGVEGGEKIGSKVIAEISVKNAHYTSDALVQKNTCGDIVSAAKPVGDNVNTGISDAGFSERLALELHKFKDTNPAFDDVYADMPEVKVLESWLQQSIYCSPEGGGGGSGGAGGGEEEGGGAGGTVAFSFLVTFVIIGGFMYHKKKKKKLYELGDKYQTVGASAGGEGDAEMEMT